MANSIKSTFEISLKDSTRAGVDSVSRSLEGLRSKVAAVGGAFAAIGAGVAVAGLAQSARQVVELGDKLRDLSFATGQSVEQLSFLDFAAGQSGTSIEAISTAAQRLAKNLVDVARGGGKQAAAALRDLGLSAEQLAGESLVTQIGAVGDALARIENPSQRAAAGAALFGRQFKELAPLILEGREGIGRLEEAFVSFGGTLTREQADSFDAMNDALGELRLSVRQAGEAVATAFAPAIAGLASKVADFVNNIGPALTSRFFDIKVALLDASRAVQKSKLDFVEFFNVFGIGDASVDATKQRIAEITAEIQRVRDAQQGVIDDVLERRRRDREAINAPVSGSLDVEDEAAKSALDSARLKAEKELAKEQRARMQTYNAAVDETLRQIEEEARQWEELDRRRQSVIEASMTPLEKQLAKLKEIKELVGDTGDTYGRAAIEAFNELNPEIDTTTEKAKQLEKTFAEMGATFSSAFEDAILNGEKFSDVLVGLGKDIARLLLRATVTDPLASIARDILKSGSVGGGIGDFFKGLFSNAQGGLYKVAGAGGGERPVAFTAQPGEMVAVGRPGDGGGITVINVGAAPSRTERRQVNGKRQLVQFFSSTAYDAASEGALASLGLSPPLVAR